MATVSNECHEAPVPVMERIQAGVPFPVSPGYMVRSAEFAKVWFVAAAVEISGLEGRRVGVWATNALDDGGLTFAVNDVALEHSSWGSGPRTRAELTMLVEAAQLAHRCCLEHLG